MGEVWSGAHRTEGQPVAVKLLTAAVAQEARSRQALRNEARAVAQLDHPHVVMVHDFGEVDAVSADASGGRLEAGVPWIAMELAGSGTLIPLCGRLTWGEARGVCYALLDALAHAHARGVIHRDLKPGNVLVTDSLEVKLTDFGLAHALDRVARGEDVPLAGGTPSFMAPEQFLGSWRYDGPWTDLYALGCTLWALVKGSPPFGVVGDVGFFRQAHRHRRPPPLNPPIPVPPGFEEWLRRLLAKDPAQRFRRAADAAWALAALGPPVGEPDALPMTLGADAPTLVLEGVLSRARSQRGVYGMDGDAAEPGVAMASLERTAPPLPASWRREGGEVRGRRLRTSGLGLFGLRSLPLVDRVEARDKLWAALAAVREGGRPRAVVLHGPSGVGCSRLASWVAQRAHEVGSALVLTARHAPVPTMRHGLRGMLTELLRCQGLDRDEVIARVAATLSSHGVVDRAEVLALSELVQPGPAEGQDQLRFGSPAERYECVRRLLVLLCVERPVVMCIDDAHHGPDAVAFVKWLLEHQDRSLEVLALLTFSDEELQSRVDAAAALRALRAHPQCSAIALGPLGPAEHRALVRELLPLDPVLAADVEARTAGSPLFAVQLVGDWVARGALVPGPDGYRLDRESVKDLPLDLGAVWVDRVERVLAGRSEAEGLALEAAAVLGLDVDADEWLAVCMRIGADPSEALLEELLTQQLARCGEEGPTFGWRFAHSSLQRALLQRAHKHQRLRGVHEVCAQLLAELAARQPGLPGVAERLGRHLLGAGRADDALAPLLAGAQAAVVSGEYGRAAALLDARERAMTAAKIGGEDARRGEGELLAAELRAKRGEFDAARAQLQRVGERARQFGWDAVSRRWAVAHAKDLVLAGQLPEAARLLRLASQEAEQAKDARLVFETRLHMAEVLAGAGEYDAAERQLQVALARARGLRDEGAVALCWQALGEVHKERGEASAALTLMLRAEQAFRSAGHRWGVASSLNSQGDVARYAGDFSRAESLYRESLALFGAIGSAARVIPAYNQALMQLTRGEVALARPVLEQALLHFVRQQRADGAADANLALACCASAEGRWLQWDEYMAEARTWMQRASGPDQDTARLARLAAEWAEGAGEPDRARLAAAMVSARRG